MASASPPQRLQSAYNSAYPLQRRPERQKPHRSLGKECSWAVVVGLLVCLSRGVGVHAQLGGANNPFQENYGTPEDAPVVNLMPFVDPLPVPRVISLPALKGPLRLYAFRTSHKFHRDLPPSPVYAFGPSLALASVPGPTLVAQRGLAAQVQWGNNITDKHHFLPVDRTLGCQGTPTDAVPIVVHLHGARVESTSDGHPDAWWTASGATGPTFSRTLFSYPNQQPGGTLWYHDHTSCLTRLNVAAGLLGAYILKDPLQEASLKLPGGNFDVPLLIQDKYFTRTGSIWFARKGGNSEVHPSWMSEYYGAHLTVNGKVAPFMKVLPRRYRFRVINAANARFLTLVLQKGGRRPLPFTQVAADGGLLPRAVTMNQLTISPGERAEIVVDFSLMAPGTAITMLNAASAPFRAGPAGRGAVMLFQVQAAPAGMPRDLTSVPAVLNADMPPLDTSGAKLRVVPVSEILNMENGYPFKGMLEFRLWTSPVTATPRLGDRELWYVINLTQDWHAFHIHFTSHRVVWRRPVDSMKYRMQTCGFTPDKPTCFTGPPLAPLGNERGWKDTTQVAPDMVTALLVDFDPWMGQPGPFDPTQGPGYVFHCHMLDHEDNSMMRPLRILPRWTHRGRMSSIFQLFS